MEDEIFRIERIQSAIREICGVLEAYDLNLAETAYVAKCIGEAAKMIYASKANPAE